MANQNAFISQVLFETNILVTSLTTGSEVWLWNVPIRFICSRAGDQALKFLPVGSINYDYFEALCYEKLDGPEKFQVSEIQ